jgi:hypothetical protein
MSRIYCLFSKLIEMKARGGGGVVSW